MFFLSLKRQLVHQTVGSFGVIRVDRQSTIRALNSHREMKTTDANDKPFPNIPTRRVHVMLKVGLGFSFASGCLGHLPRIGLPAIDVNDNSRLGL